MVVSLAGGGRWYGPAFRLLIQICAWSIIGKLNQSAIDTLVERSTGALRVQSGPACGRPVKSRYASAIRPVLWWLCHPEPTR